MENETAMKELSAEKVNEFACGKFDNGTMRYAGGKIAGPIDEAYKAKVKAIVIEEGVTEIAQKAFFDCMYLKSIELPASLTLIGDGAFEDCFNLKSLKIPAGVADLPTAMCRYCEELREVTLPVTLKQINYDVFDECVRLKNIYYQGTMEQWNAIYKSSDFATKGGKFTVHCTDGDVPKG